MLVRPSAVVVPILLPTRVIPVLPLTPMTADLKPTAVRAKLLATAVEVELPLSAVVRAKLPLTPVVPVLPPTPVVETVLAATPGVIAELPPTAVGAKRPVIAVVPHQAELATQLGIGVGRGDSAALPHLSPAAVEVDLHHACAGWRRENRLAVRDGVVGNTSHLTRLD